MLQVKWHLVPDRNHHVGAVQWDPVPDKHQEVAEHQGITKKTTGLIYSPISSVYVCCLS